MIAVDSPRRSTGQAHASAAARACVLITALTIAQLTLRAVSTSAQTADPNLWVTNGQVYTMAKDGATLYIGGSFSQVGPATGGGVPLSAATGNPLTPFPRIGGEVQTVLADGSGGWFIGGAFTTVGGLERLNLAHILADGRVAPWAPNPNGPVRSLAFAGHKVYACGPFTWIGMRWRSGVASIDSASGIATPWNPAVENGTVHVVAASPGLVTLGGTFTSFDGAVRNRLAAVAPVNDSLISWGPAFNGPVTTLAVSGDVVYVGGEFSLVGGQSRGLAALNRVTGVLTSWNPEVQAVNAIAVSGPTVYLGGAFTSVSGQARNYLAAVDSATGVPTPWNPNANGFVQAMAVSGGTVYVGGTFTIAGNRQRNGLAALDSATALARPWDPHPNDRTEALAVAGDAVYAGGAFQLVGGVNRNNIAAIDLGTGIATAWDPSANGEVLTIAASGGLVYVGGGFQYIGRSGRGYLAALDPVTGDATGWHPFLDGWVQTLLVSGQTVYAGGNFRVVGNLMRNSIAAIDAGTGIPSSWNPDALGGVYALAFGGGGLYIGGGFRYVSGQPRSAIANVDTVTGAPTPWDPAANGTVKDIVVSGGTVYAGGDFNQIGGKVRSRIAALDAGSGLATAWDAGASGTVSALAVSGNTVYAGGNFGSIGGVTRTDLAALDAATGSATLWNPGLDGRVFDLLAAGSTVYACGDFATVAGQPNRSPAALQGWVGTPAAAPVFTTSVDVSASTVAVGQAVTITAVVRNDGAASDDGRIAFSFKDLTDPSDGQRLSSASAGDAPGVRVYPRGSTLLGRDCRTVNAGYLVAEYADSDWAGLGGETDTFRVTVWPRAAGVFSIDVRATMRAAGGGSCDYVNALPVNGQTYITDQQGWTVRRFVVTVIGTPALADPYFLSPVGVSASSIVLGQAFTISTLVQNSGALSDDGRIAVSFPDLTDPGDISRVTCTSVGDDLGFRVFPAGAQLGDTSCQPLVASYLVAEYADSSWQPIGYEWNTFNLSIQPRAVGTFTCYVRATMRTAGAAPCAYVNHLPVNGETGYVDQQGWPVVRFTVTVNPAPTAADPSFTENVAVSRDTITLGESFSIGAVVRNHGSASDDGRIVFSFPSFTDAGDTSRVVSGSSGDYPGFRLLRTGATLLGKTCQPVVAPYLVAEYADNNWEWFDTEIQGFATLVTPRSVGTFVVDVRSTMHTAGGAPCDYVNDLPANGQGGFSDPQGWAVKRFVVVVQPAPTAAQPAFLRATISSPVVRVGDDLTITAEVLDLGAASDDGRIVIGLPSFTDPADSTRANASSGGDTPGFHRVTPGSPLLTHDCQPMTAGYLVAEYDDNDWQWLGRETNTFELHVVPKAIGDFWVEFRTTMHTAGSQPCDLVNAVPASSGGYGTDQQGWTVWRQLVTVTSSPPLPVFTTGVSLSSTLIDLGQTVTIVTTARNDGIVSDDGRVVFGFPGLVNPADAQRISTGASDDQPGYRLLPAGAPLADATCQPMTSGYLVAEYADSDWERAESKACTLTVRPRLAGPFEIDVRSSMHTTGGASCGIVNAVPPDGTPLGSDQQGWAVRRYIVTVNPAPAVATPLFVGDVSVSSRVIALGQPLTITATVRDNGPSSDDGRIVIGFPALDQAGDAQFVGSTSGGDAPGYRVIPPGGATLTRGCQAMTSRHAIAEYADAAWDSMGDETNTFTVTVRPPREGLFAIEVRSTLHTPAPDACLWTNAVPANGQGGFTDQEGWEVKRFDVLVGAPQSVTWNPIVPPGAAPVPRASHAAVYDPLRDELVMYGGTALTYTGDSWALPLAPGGTWSPLQPGGPVPLRRIQHSMVVDPATSQLLIFGGLYDDIMDDLWILARSPVNWWFPVSEAVDRPVARMGQAAIYDPVRQRMLLIGGFSRALLNDVWEYAPLTNGTWRQLAPQGGPLPPRSTFGGVYDPVRDRVLVFGGDGGALRNDVWELRLTDLAWAQVGTTGAPPSPRREMSMVYDPQFDELVVFGGFDGSTRLDDVWTLSLDGVPKWERRFPGTLSPTGRSGHSAIYDPLRQRIVVFGGQLGSTTFSNEVWELKIDRATPVELSLAETAVDASGVHLAWYGEGAAALRAEVERATEQGDWLDLGAATADGHDRLVFTDSAVEPGTRYAYQLRVWQDGKEEILGPVWVTVPERAVLSLAGATPNPVSDAFAVSFTLPGRSPGALELFDLRGRRVAATDLAAFEAGPHRVVLAEGRHLPAGVYWLRLTHGDRRLIAKACVVR